MHTHTHTLLYTKQCWKGKNKIGKLTLPGSKYCIFRVCLMTLMYWFKDRKIDQWDKIDSLQRGPYIFGMIYNRSDIAEQRGINRISPTHVPDSVVISIRKRKNWCMTGAI